VFQVTPDGRFATLVSFANTNGAVPLAPLTFGSDGNLYGTTFAGGSEDRSGTVFRIVLREPVVFSQPEPANQDVVVGANINLSASYIGASPLTAQWMFNGNALPGETNATLILGNVRPSTSGNYSLRVSNSLGSTFSSNTVLAVLPALITNLPTVGITDTGAVLSASVTVGPGETLIWFEWGVDTNYGQIDGITNLPGGSGTTRFSADLSGLDKNMIYHYRVVAWNSFGIVYGSDQTFRVGRIHAYAQSVLGDRPLVYYRFNETNSSVALNSGLFGEAVNGTYGATVSLGDPSLVPAFGYAAGFNNTNTDVAVPALGSHPRITIEAWLKPRSSARFDYFDSIYATDDWTPGALHTHLVDRFSFPEFEFSINGNDPQWVNPGAPSLFLTNRWVHLAAAYDSVAREVTTYVNGKPLTTNSFRTAVPVNLTAAHIGQFKGSANWFDGEIDEFAIYDSVLSAERIREHYQAAIGNPVLLSAPLTNKLVLSWVGPGLRLEANADLANAAGWTPVIGGSNSPVTLIPSNSINQFYRLKWP
jgi:uncharacterized repeat protein (TIGR03803 family)